MKVIWAILFGIVFSSCTTKTDKVLENFVGLNSPTPISIGNDDYSFVIRKVQNEDKSETLLVDYPAHLLQQELLFGGTITEASDAKDESVGGLKMSSLEPLFVRGTVVKKDDNQKVLVLKACKKDCTESKARVPVVEIPVTNSNADVVTLDLSKLGAQIDVLKEMWDSWTEAGWVPPETKIPWTYVSSYTRNFDYSDSTLVFDVVTVYEAESPEGKKSFELATRWFLKNGAVHTPYFEPRPSTKEVGFFSTSRSAQKFIIRFRRPDAENGPIKYYIKHVPKEYRDGFAQGFDAWNERTKDLFGTKLLDYEFLEDNDPRNEAIVAGDIRYNVMEWDLKNKAGYGGLGPSINLQDTGENLSGNVLIQGPNIVQMYKKWFNITSESDLVALERLTKKMDNSKFEVQVNGWSFKIPSQDPSLRDEVRMDFTAPPAGYDYMSYMQHYFRDMVAHELGHNLGLAHNFRGNMGSTDTGLIGSASRSIMEYLSASFRHLDTVGEYDVMAIAYGYLGKKPEHDNWYCGDEESQGSPLNSAECSSEDATSDPFSYLVDMLTKVMVKTVAFGESEKPDWTPKDLERYINRSVTGLARYASSAVFTSNKWTNFFGKPDRPKDAIEVPLYVLGKMNGLICNQIFDEAAAMKSSEDRRVATRDNLKAVRNAMAVQLKAFGKPFPLGNPLYFPCLDFSVVPTKTPKH